MDKFRVIWYLLEEYNVDGVVYPKSAKEIAEVTKISLTETYRTLQGLREDGLIWRVGRRNLYRFGLKEETLSLLDKLYKCIINNKPLPTELTINLEDLEKIAHKKHHQLEIEEKEREVIVDINYLLNKLEIIPEEICINKITGTIERITNSINTQNDSTEKIREYIQEELEEIKDYIFGMKLKGGGKK